MLYLILKSLHVVSVVLFLGNIITGVFWKVHARYRGYRGARAPRRSTASSRAIGLFTMPGVFAIIITGVALAMHAGLSDAAAPVDSLVADPVRRSRGWPSPFRVAPLQKKLLANARAGLAGTWNEAEYKTSVRCLDAVGRGRDAGAADRRVPHGDEAGVSMGMVVARGRGIARITHRFLASVAKCCLAESWPPRVPRHSATCS